MSRSCGKLASVFSLLMVLATVASSVHVSAAGSAAAQYWTYDVSMDVGGMNATGTVTYALVGQQKLTVNGTSFDAQAYGVSGHLSASSTLLGALYNLSMVLGGTRYEGRNGLSLAKDDFVQFVNISIGSSPPQVISRMQLETVTEYSPPYLSKFDTTSTAPGDSWTEPVVVDTTTVLNGSAKPTVSSFPLYTVQVSAEEETIDVGAGTFAALRITVTEASGGDGVYWWSPELRHVIAEKTYESGSSQPDKVLSLTAHGMAAEPAAYTLTLLGAALVAVSVAVLALILNARGRGRRVDQQHPPAAPDNEEGPPGAQPPGGS